MSADILIVDDECAIADLVEVYLKNEGYTVHKFYTAADALACVNHTKLDLAILDVMLPDMDGFTLCQKIRENHLFPILMLSAKVEDMDKITGLTLGADDYITKPFNPLELVARAKTQLRDYIRYNPAGGADTIQEYDIRGLQISKATHKCILFGEELLLTPLEFSILWYLCSKQGQVVSSEELFEAVWGEKYIDSNNTVMSHIARPEKDLELLLAGAEQLAHPTEEPIHLPDTYTDTARLILRYHSLDGAKRICARRNPYSSQLRYLESASPAVQQSMGRHCTVWCEEQQCSTATVFQPPFGFIPTCTNRRGSYPCCRSRCRL